MNYSERAKRRREKLKTDGLCIDCGKQSAGPGVRCDACYKSHKEKQFEWRTKHKVAHRARNKKWYQDNKDRSRAAGRKHRFKLRSLVIEQLGGKCECCGEVQREWLQIDHKNKDGKKHREEVGRSKSLWRDMLRNPGKYEVRVLCANCHNAITCYGYCPHKIPQVSQDVPLALVEGS